MDIITTKRVKELKKNFEREVPCHFPRRHFHSKLDLALLENRSLKEQLNISNAENHSLKEQLNISQRELFSLREQLKKFEMGLNPRERTESDKEDEEQENVIIREESEKTIGEQKEEISFQLPSSVSLYTITLPDTTISPRFLRTLSSPTSDLPYDFSMPLSSSLSDPHCTHINNLAPDIDGFGDFEETVGDKKEENQKIKEVKEKKKKKGDKKRKENRRSKEEQRKSSDSADNAEKISRKQSKEEQHRDDENTQNIIEELEKEIERLRNELVAVVSLAETFEQKYLHEKSAHSASLAALSLSPRSLPAPSIEDKKEKKVEIEEESGKGYINLAENNTQSVSSSSEKRFKGLRVFKKHKGKHKAKAPSAPPLLHLSPSHPSFSPFPATSLTQPSNEDLMKELEVLLSLGEQLKEQLAFERKLHNQTKGIVKELQLQLNQYL